ncbi:MAG: phosphopantetheine-binding protein [Caulobacterales bacterium]
MAEIERGALMSALKAMIVKECDKDMEPDEIGDEDRLIGGELDLDSLDALQISMAVKDRYGVRIEGGPESRKALASVSALADYILDAKAAAA